MSSIQYLKGGANPQRTAPINHQNNLKSKADTPDIALSETKKTMISPALSQVYFGAKPSEPSNAFSAIQDILKTSVDPAHYAKEAQVISFDDYLKEVYDSPKLIRTSAQRAYDMIMEKGRKLVEVDGKQLYVYDFFKDPLVKDDTISGMEQSIHEFVDAIGGAAAESGPEKRIILLVGPVGTAKTTMVNVLKRGLEQYTKTDQGAMYSLQWDLTSLKKAGVEAFEDLDAIIDSPMHEDPFLLVSNEKSDPNATSPREQVVEALNLQLKSAHKKETGQLSPYSLSSRGKLSPTSEDIYKRLMVHYEGDFSKVLKHAKAKRFALNEAARDGITTFEPADEKSLRRGHLTGEVNLKKLMQRGSDSDVHAFSYDGELPQGNRGLGHFDELLKIPKSLLYPLLSASEQKAIKADKFPMISYDGMLIGTTNIPDWTKTKADKHLEAIRSRIIQIEVPYNSRIDDEEGIYKKGFVNNAKKQDIHVAPHSTFTAALWAVMTRLAAPPVDLSLLQKALLYNGEQIKDYTKQKVTQLKKDVPDEASELLSGVSPRDIQDALSNALIHPSVTDAKEGTRTVDPFLVIDSLRKQLGTGGVSNLNKEERDSFDGLLEDVEMEVARRMIKDVNHALAGDEEDVKHLFDKYIKHLNAWYLKERVKDESTGRLRDPDEGFMTAIEDRMGWTDASRGENRHKLMAMAGIKTQEGTPFTYLDDQTLQNALEEHLISKFSDISFPVIGQREHATREDQEKIDVIKTRLITDFGYNEHSAEIAMKLINDPKYKGSFGD